MSPGGAGAVKAVLVFEGNLFPKKGIRVSRMGFGAGGGVVLVRNIILSSFVKVNNLMLCYLSEYFLMNFKWVKVRRGIG